MDWRHYIEQNPSILLSDKRLRALLSDVYMNDRLSINVLMNAYGIGIIQEMREKYPVDRFTAVRWSKRLVNEFGISEEKADWAVNTWIAVLSAKVLSELDRAEKDLLADEEEERLKKEEELRLLAEEVIKQKEAEEAQREEERRSSADRLLKLKEDYDNYYINPSLNEREDCIYCPCGFGKGDGGFLIYGIKKTNLCLHKDANVFALIYNYLTRNSIITADDIPHMLKEQDSLYELDYQTIYRLAIVLLQLVRHNLARNGAIVLEYSEDIESLKYAVRIINNYAALFCRLIGIEQVRLRVKTGKGGIPLSLHAQIKGVYVTDNTDIVSNARELWYGRKINYHLSKSNLKDLEYILHEISDFEHFKEGQLSALCDMLSCRKHSVCIMPTGSGKSLIFYMASLLQPLPMFIVSPTDILIQDQLRNLKQFHHMDNAAHLQLTDENSFADWEIHNSLNYLTPMTFQNRHLLVKFRGLNNGTKRIGLHDERIAAGALVSYVVLDEIHCLSNWGHDFRPEYLMLSKYLNKFFDHISFWGFTATANYMVVEDVQKQLDIPQDNFFSPIAFERFNVSYDYRKLHSEQEMLDEIARISALHISRNERTIVFTKSSEISERVADAIGCEADIFATDNPSAYYNFAAGKSKILVADSELGVGINLPEIRNIIHFGLPLSKNEYVQEIGRAGRENGKVTSYVLYLDESAENVPDGLLRRNAPIDKLPILLEGYAGDFAQVYRKLSNGALGGNELYERLIEMYEDFKSRDRALYVDSFEYEKLDRAKQLLYMLYVTGYIYDWYSYSKSKDGGGVDILIDICSTDAASYKSDPNKMLKRMKARLNDYFVYMGNSRMAVSRLARAKSVEAVIQIYVDWYYEKYLYHHNEQFLDLYEFITANTGADADKITEEIKDYFVLPFAKLKSDEALYNELSMREIIAKTAVGVSKTTLVNLERINSNRYSYKLDLAIFCGNLRMNGVFDESRLDRLLSKLDAEDINMLGGVLPELYISCRTEAKLELLKFMKRRAAAIGTSYEAFLERAYSSGKKDEVYYGIMANRLNKCFDKIGRINHV